MSLDYCSECQTVEGKWQIKLISADDNVNFDEVRVCGECGAEDSWQGIPEHDDGDMGR